jgi:hypothetical protein
LRRQRKRYNTSDFIWNLCVNVSCLFNYFNYFLQTMRDKIEYLETQNKELKVRTEAFEELPFFFWERMSLLWMYAF